MAGEAAGGGVHQLLPDLRQRGDRWTSATSRPAPMPWMPPRQAWLDGVAMGAETVVTLPEVDPAAVQRATSSPPAARRSSRCPSGWPSASRTKASPATSPSTASASAPASSASARPARPTSPTPAAPSRTAEVESCTGDRPRRRSSSASAPTPWRWSSASENDFLTDVTKEQLAQDLLDRRDVVGRRSVLAGRADPALQPRHRQRHVRLLRRGHGVRPQDEGSPLLAAKNLQLSEDDNVLVQGVEGSPYAIGYFGYAYYQENTGQAEGALDRRRRARRPRRRRAARTRWPARCSSTRTPRSCRTSPRWPPSSTST